MDDVIPVNMPDNGEGSMTYIPIRVPRPRMMEGEDEPVMVRQVIVTDDMPERTGLLDHMGTPLYRVRETVLFGFRK